MTKGKLERSSMAILVLASCLLLVLISCAEGAIVETEGQGTQNEGPLLGSDHLVRSLPLPVRSSIADAGIKEGELAVDFKLLDMDGTEASLSGLLVDKPVVMILGSFT